MFRETKWLLLTCLVVILFTSFPGMTTSPTPLQLKKKKILLDRYFNSEKRKNSNGELQYFHYTWEEQGFPGFSEFGKLFTEQGAALLSEDGPPDIFKMEDVAVYIIVDPDNRKDNPDPNYIGVSDIPGLKSWVELGGVLVLMGNDSSNCDLSHLNKLSEPFGIRFTDQTVNKVPDDQFELGTVKSVRSDIISSSLKMFMKEACPLKLSGKAVALAKSGKEVVMAYARYEKGLVLAIGDPWLYNEYIDDRRGLKGFDNREAAKQLVTWLLRQSKEKKYIFN